MLSLRYAATRFLAQASKPSVTVRPVQRLSVQPCSTAFTRSFHQSWKALAYGQPHQSGERRERSFSRGPGGDRRGPVRQRQTNPEPSGTVFIGNLLFDVTPAQIEAELSPFGEIVKARVVTDERGLSKGFGFVEFSSTEAATKAIEAKSGQPFFGRDLILNYANSPTQPEQPPRPAPAEYPPSNVLFIGNMSFQMSDRDLNDLFRDIKNVVDVRVAIDRRTGQPRGFAHADFIDTESATTAKELLEAKVLYGRTLRVNYSPPKPSPAADQAKDEAKDEETPSA